MSNGTTGIISVEVNADGELVLNDGRFRYQAFEEIRWEPVGSEVVEAIAVRVSENLLPLPGFKFVRVENGTLTINVENGGAPGQVSEYLLNVNSKWFDKALYPVDGQSVEGTPELVNDP